MKREPRRPDATYRFPEGDVDTLRKSYATNSKELLEEAFIEYKKYNRNAKTLKLPATFKEVLDTEKGGREGDKTPSTYPTKFYIGIIGRANIILQDTESAKAIIERIDSGDYSVKPKDKKEMIEEIIDDLFFPDMIDETSPKVLAGFMLEPSEDKDATIKKKLAEIRVNAEMFVDPGGTLEKMIGGAKNETEKQNAIALYKALTEIGFSDIAEDVAKETGADVDDVMNPKKRTKKQYNLLLSAIRRTITEKTEAVYKSNFIHAVWEIGANYESKSKLSTATQDGAAKYAALYFFALHPEINLREHNTLKEQHTHEVCAIYDRLLASMERQRKDAYKKKDMISTWAAFMKFVEEENPEEDITEIIKTTAKEVSKAQFQLDKLNSNVWNDLSYSRPTFEAMQLSMGFSFDEHRDELPAVNTASQKNKSSGNNALVLWGLRFEELPENVKITKELTPYDRLCHDAVGTLYRAGARVVTPTQIYKAMGRETKPNKRDVEKINASLTKMRAAVIYIDNTDERAVNKKYPQFKYDGVLLPFERLKAVVNGKETETAIRILAEPPLVRFARLRDQYTTFPLSVWAFPLSLTNTQIRIAQYLTEYICHTKKNPKLSKDLTFDTFYSNCGLTTKLQKQRGREAAEKLIEYWRDKCNPAFIGKKSKLGKDRMTFDT